MTGVALKRRRPRSGKEPVIFLGTIEPEVRAIVQEHVREWRVDDVYVGCSGAFTIERFLGPLGHKMHGNDVSIYTCQIGKYLSGQPVDFTLREESQAELAWLEPYMQTDADKIATLMLGTRFLQFVGKSGRYFDRMLDGFRRQFDDMHASTVEKVKAVTVRLESFHAMDVREWLTGVVPPDGPVASFPPFDVGGYETMWKPLDQHFTWDEPEYEVLDDQGIKDTLDLIMDRDHWILASNHRRADWEDRLVGVVQTSQRRRPNYVYASTRRTRIVKPRTVMEPVKVPRLGRGDRIGDTIKLAVLTLPQFNFLRAQYLNPKIRVAAPGAQFAVLSEGRLVGAIGVLPGKFDPDEIYLLSDFAVPSSDYRRLSKLVVMAALSKEMQHLMQNAMSRPIRKIATTAFTQNPVSMKYRGCLQMTSRKESTDPDWKFELQYGGTVGEMTLDEVVAEWRRRGWDDVKGGAE